LFRFFLISGRNQLLKSTKTEKCLTTSVLLRKWKKKFLIFDQKNVLSHRPTLTPLQRLLLMIRSQSRAMKIPWPCCILKNIFNRRFLFVAIVLFLLFLPNGRLEKLVPTPVVTLNATFFQKLQPSCPKLYPQIFADQAPKGKFGSDESSITLTRNKDATNVEDCVASCCTNLNCQMVFMYKNNSLINCYHVSSFLI
jgi:hypothetical protein